MHLTFDLVTGIFWVSVSLQAQLCLSILRRLGIQRRQIWLVKLAGLADDSGKASAAQLAGTTDNLQFYMVGPSGDLRIPQDRNVDVEAEMRRKHQRTGTYSTEEALGENVYSWWRSVRLVWRR